MSQVLIPFGWHRPSEQAVDIHDVPRGLHCQCVCPSCDTPLIARKGEEKVWHFAHASRAVYEHTGQECRFSFWVSVRMMARQLLAHSGSVTIRLPRFTERQRRFSKKLDQWFWKDVEIAPRQDIVIQDPVMEAQLPEAVVDLAGHVKGTPFCIYFTHPGRAVPDELAQPAQPRMGVVAIALDQLEPVFLQERRHRGTYLEELGSFITNSDQARHWVYHPKRARLQRQAQDELSSLIGAAEQAALAAATPPPAVPVRFRCVMCRAEWVGQYRDMQDCPNGHDWQLATPLPPA